MKSMHKMRRSLVTGNIFTGCCY